MVLLQDNRLLPPLARKEAGKQQRQQQQRIQQLEMQQQRVPVQNSGLQQG
jgi:hypothetical protein